jgi:hypothetical protein
MDLDEHTHRHGMPGVVPRAACTQQCTVKNAWAVEPAWLHQTLVPSKPMIYNYLERSTCWKGNHYGN